LISEQTGEWESERVVLDEFYRIFEERIKYLFANDNAAYN
jgi:hypothetical protein